MYIAAAMYHTNLPFGPGDCCKGGVRDEGAGADDELALDISTEAS